MDMQIDIERLKLERESRAWTQSHLAAACDLSLRTIQRVEKSGAASPETVQALAAVFQVPLSELIADRSTTDAGSHAAPARAGLRWLVPAVCLAMLAMAFRFDEGGVTWFWSGRPQVAVLLAVVALGMVLAAALQGWRQKR